MSAPQVPEIRLAPRVSETKRGPQIQHVRGFSRGPLKKLKVIREGEAEILLTNAKVFYNPVQEFNRDLSVLVLQAYAREFHRLQNQSILKRPLRLLEPLAATGLRSIRYAKEVSGLGEVVANDISSDAVKNMEANIKHNKVEHIMKTSHSSASILMMNCARPTKKFDVIDLDPYGSPVQFLDSAIQCIEDGGLLLVTCTDLAVLCGNFPDSCYAKYGAIPLKIPAVHEMAIRIVLQSIHTHAARYKRFIIPILSISVDFYIRIFVKVYTGALIARNSTSKLSMVYRCTGCESLTLQPLTIFKKSSSGKTHQAALPTGPPVGEKCKYCGGKHQLGGPIWNAPIHDPNLISEMLLSQEINDLSTAKRLFGVLSLLKEELLDVPLYYVASNICSTLRTSVVPMMVIRSAILNKGYRVSFSHAHRVSIKTDAPPDFIWDLLKAWMKSHNFEAKNVVPDSPADVLHKAPIRHEIDFTPRPDAKPLSMNLKLTRFQMNPLPYWGPGTKSTTMNLLDQNPKKIRNQNKKKIQKEFRKKADFPEEYNEAIFTDQYLEGYSGTED